MNKKTGQFKHLLAIDCETTGLCFSGDSPVHDNDDNERHQTVSWGVLVVEASTLDVVDKTYVEIKWNDRSHLQRKQNPSFGLKAESVHGLTQEYLADNGITEEQACVEIGSLIAKYWGPTSGICTLGHNVVTFDMMFLRDLFRRQGIELNLHNRHVDTNAIGFANWETYTSDQLFQALGFDDRKDHNALHDIEMTLECVRVSRMIMNAPVNQRVMRGLKA